MNVLFGKYADGFKPVGTVNRLIKVGDSLDLNEDIKQYFLPEDEIDFSDEKVNFSFVYNSSAFKLEDGVIESVNQGNCGINATLTNGDTLTYYISASQEPTSIWFSQKEYSYSKTQIGFNSLKYELRSDQNNAISYVSSEDITWTAEGLDAKIDNNGYIQSTNGEVGDVTVTAKYKDLTATCIIHFYDGNDPYVFELEGNAPAGFKMCVGDVKRLPVKVGASNSIESVEIYDGDNVISYNEETKEVTAVGTGDARLNIKDKLGKTLYLHVSCGPKVESIKFKNSVNDIYIRRNSGSKTISLLTYLEIAPQNAYKSTNIDYRIIDGDSDSVHISPTGDLYVMKEGNVKIKAITDTGLETITEFKIHAGNYTGQPSKNYITINLKPGEDYNISNDIISTFTPRGADFSDEKVSYTINDDYIGGKKDAFSVDDDGTIHALKNGMNQMIATTFSGYTIYVNVVVCDKVNSIEFKEKEYNVNLSGAYSSGLALSSEILKIDPDYINQFLDNAKVEYTVSDDSVAYIDSPAGTTLKFLRAKKEGTVQLTAEYDGCKATTTVNFYYAKTPVTMNVPGEITVHKGFTVNFNPEYDQFSDTSTKYELVDGKDIVKISSYSDFCNISGNDLGDATIEVTSKSNPALTKRVKIHVVDGNPTDTEFKVFSYDKNSEIRSKGNYVYQLDLNKEYHIEMEYTEFEHQGNKMINSNFYSSDLIKTNGYGAREYGATIKFKTLKPGTLTFTAYPGIDVTFLIGFTDVQEDTPHSEDINWLANTGVSQGWTEEDGSRTFRPFVNVARCDMAAFIRRLAKDNNWLDAATWKPSEADWTAFVDIDPSTPHAEDVLWLAHSEISEGWDIGSGKKEFRPYVSVARCDMAAFLYRLASKAGVSDAATWSPTESDWAFTDVNTGSSHVKEVLWLAHSGVSKGWVESDGTKTFRPLQDVARCDMAAFLHRLNDLH